MHIQNTDLINGQIPKNLIDQIIETNDTTLDLRGCTSLTELPALPAGLKGLSLGSCTSLTELPALPDSLEYLDLNGCTSLTALPALPAGLQSLYLSGCTSLTTLPALPDSLISLDLGRCTSLTALPDLPAGLKTLDLRNCTSLTALPALPAGLQFLYLGGGRSLKALPALPAGLKFLYLNGCTSLTALPDLPASLINLDLSNASLTALPDLPAGLKDLNLNACTSLTALPALLAGLKYLNLNACTSLTALPALPAGLKYLKLSGCISLVASADLLQNLQSLNSKGCNIEWPDHLRIDVAKNRMASIIERYKQTNPAGAESTATLFDRFCTEGLEQRDGAYAVAASVNPFLDLLETEPNHLTWINKIAGIYLDGCVNQPVAGFAEISAWVSVAQKPEIAAKIEAAHQLMALDTLKEFVANSNPKPGARVEVEAGNALLREVHKILVSSQMEPWPGVPGSISYAGTINSWLTPKNIIAATGKVAEVMAAPAERVMEYLLERYTETWATVAFPKEYSRISEEYAAKRDALARLLNPELYEPKSKDSSPSPLCQTALTEFNKVLAAIPQQQHPEKIAELSRKLERAEQEEIARSARALTEAAVRQPAARTTEQKEREEKEPTPDYHANRVKNQRNTVKKVL